MGNALRAPAHFPRLEQHRRSMIAKVNVARHQLQMVEDDYRQLLFSITGRTSLKECSDGQLSAMIEALKGKGFRPLPGKAKHGHAATHPMARKARAMWISLHHLGVVHNPSEKALEAFAKRQLKCEHFAWAKQSEGGKLIEALKDMATRNGWRLTDHNGKPLERLGLSETLCLAILKRLQDARFVPDDWTLNIAAERLLGITTELCAPFTVELYRQIAGGLGEQLRASGALTGDQA